MGFSRPMKDYIIDYTWRANGKEIVKCPVCKKQGVLRQQPDDDSYTVVHRESPRVEDNRAYYQEFCTATEEQIRIVLHRKEVDRVYSFEHNRRLRLKKLENR